jgi:hypothetical protein
MHRSDHHLFLDMESHMKTTRFFLILYVFIALSLGGLQTARAAANPPPNPSSFYGELRYASGDTAPTPGDYLEAYVSGVTGYVSHIATTNNPDDQLVYAINVPGDDEYTSPKDGGLENDDIVFKVNGRIVGWSRWHGGTNVRLHFHPPQGVLNGARVVEKGLSSAYSGMASPDLGSDVNYNAFDFDGNGSYESGGSGPVNHTWATSGVHPLGMLVTDILGGEGKTQVDVVVVELGGLTGQVYDGNPKPVSITGVVAPYTYEVNYAGSSDAPTNAGSYSVIVAVRDAGSSLIGTLTRTLVIGQRPITVTAADKSKILGAGDPPLTYSITVGSLAPGDSISGSLTRESGESIGAYGILRGSLSAGSNYNLTFVPGAFTIQALQHTLSLAEGWNLVSLDLAPVSTAIADVLASIAGNYDLVYAWDASLGSDNWLKYDNIPASPDDLTNLDEKMGFWIHMLAADVLEVQGTQPGVSHINLWNNAGGWNLVGFPKNGSLALPGVLEDHNVPNANYTLVYAFHASDSEDRWKLYDNSAYPYANDLKSMEPNWGYWIFVNADLTWNVGD